MFGFGCGATFWFVVCFSCWFAVVGLLFGIGGFACCLFGLRVMFASCDACCFVFGVCIIVRMFTGKVVLLVICVLIC